MAEPAATINDDDSAVRAETPKEGARPGLQGRCRAHQVAR